MKHRRWLTSVLLLMFLPFPAWGQGYGPGGGCDGGAGCDEVAIHCDEVANDCNEAVASCGEAPYASGAGESLFSKEYFGLLFDDVKEVFTSPGRWQKREWTLFSAAVLSVGAASVFDKPVWDFMRRNKTKTGDDTAGLLADVGGVYSVALLAPFYIAGQAAGNEKAVRVALDGWASSLVAAGMIAPTLKFLVGRNLPKSDEGTHSFRPFAYRFQFNGGPQSFPSGHAAQGFAIATVIASHYEETWIKALAYGMASLTSTARLYQGEHFLSDWVAGALIGTFVGKTVVHFNERRRAQKREQEVFVLPFLVSGGAGVTVMVRR